MGLTLGVTAAEISSDSASADRSINTTETDPGDAVTVTTTVTVPDESSLDVTDEFTPEFLESQFVSATENGSQIFPDFQFTAGDAVVLVFDEVGPATVAVTYDVIIPQDADEGDSFNFDGVVQVGNETVSVGGDSTLVVGEEPEPNFAVSIDSVPESVTAGEEVEVEYTVENEGDETGEQDVMFEVDGEAEGSETVELDEGETFSGTFSYETDEDDTPEIAVTVASEDDEASETVAVEEPAMFEVEIDSIDEEVETGEEITAEATVTNVGDEEDSQTITFEVDGNEEGSETVELDGEESETVTFSYETDEDDTPEVEVVVASEDDEASETVAVIGPATFDVEIDSIDEEVEAGEEITAEATVTNVGDEEDTQTITFEVDGNEEGSETVELEGEESETVSFSYETDEDDTPEVEVVIASEDDEASETVAVVGPATFEVEIDSIDEEVEAGEKITAEATVTNVGDEEGSQSITLEVDGEEEGTQMVELDGDESETVSFSYETDEDDTPEVTVVIASDDDEASATVAVRGLATFEVEMESLDEEVEVGDELTAEATVTNVGEEEGSQTIAFEVGGEEEGSETVELDEGESETVTFSYETEEGDTPEVTVVVASEDDEASGTVTVLEPARFEVAIVSVDAVVEAGETVNVGYVVENVGDVDGTQEITFEVDGSQEDDETVTLDGEDSFDGAFEYETDEDDAPEITARVASANDTDARTVAVATNASLEVVDVDPAGPVTAGDPLDVTITVENIAETEITGPVVLVVENEDGETIETVVSNVTVDAEGRETVVTTYETTMEDPPSVFVHGQTVGDASDPVEVEVEPLSRPLVVTIESVDDAVEEGDAISLEYAVENPGYAEETEEIVFTVNGTQEAAETVTLDSRESTTGTFSYTTTGSDVPAVELGISSTNDTAATAVTVAKEDDGDDAPGSDDTPGGEDTPGGDDGPGATPADGDDSEETPDGSADWIGGDDEDDDGFGPGFGPFGVLIALGAIAGYLIRRDPSTR